MLLRRISPTCFRLAVPLIVGGALVASFDLRLVAAEEVASKPNEATADGTDSGGSPAVMNEREELRRRALMEEAQELMTKGKQSMAAGQFEPAMQAFSGIRELLPDAPLTVPLREEAIALYVKASIAEAGRLAEAGDLKSAKEIMQRTLSEGMAPNEPSAVAMMERLNDPVRYNQSMNAGHAAKVDDVMGLLTQAAGFLDLALYDDAAECYRKIQAIDPTNKAAINGLDLVNLYKSEVARTGYDRTRAEQLAEVDAQWELALQPKPGQAGPAMVAAAVGSPGRISIEEKLKRIMIPLVSFEQVTLEEAVQFLRVVAASEDKLATTPESRGINFTINLEGGNAQDIAAKRIDLNLRNVPLAQVLKHLMQLTGTSYRIDDYAVVISSAMTASGELMTRTYRVPPDFITELSAGLAQQQENDDPFGAPKAGSLLTRRLGVQELLVKKGVAFPSGASAAYNASVGLLQVTNIAASHDLIERLVEVTKEKEPVAVAVQVKIIKIQQDNLKELGMDWLITPFDLGQGAFLGGGTTGNSRGRVSSDFSPTVPLPPVLGATVPGVLTSGLRSGTQIYSTNSIDAMIANPTRSSQSTQVAPGILSLSGVLADGQVQAMLRGLDQSKGADMMAAPSLVTRSGQQSKIELIREFIYPTEYDPPELPNGGGGGGGGAAARLVTPANPTAFEVRNVGIMMDVLPVADQDKRYIDITLSPEIVDFDGFVNFGSPINSIGVDEDGNEQLILLTQNQILMPVFSVKRATTQLTIADGATIAYGGLLTEGILAVEDKVPVLGELPLIGNLFTNTAHKPTKTAIVFLVHVELLDPTGRPYREIINP